MDTNPEEDQNHDNEHETSGNGHHQQAANAAQIPAAAVFAVPIPNDGGAPGTAVVKSVTTQTVEAVVVEMSNGTCFLNFLL